MIDMCKVKELLSIYYGLAKIDFCTDLKNELRLTEEFEIKKPGRGYGSFDRRINIVLFKYINSLSDERVAKNKSFVMKSHSAEKQRKKINGFIASNKQQSKIKNRERNQRH